MSERCSYTPASSSGNRDLPTDDRAAGSFEKGNRPSVEPEGSCRFYRASGVQSALRPAAASAAAFASSKESLSPWP